MDIEQSINYDGLDIKYIFKERKYDCNSMIIVFSGFGAVNNFTYDFKNALSNIYAHVLWIKDDFYGEASYYYASNGIEIHEKINNFIISFSEKFNIKKNEIILSGFSKGGSAALFYGLKYDYNKIICTVPQLKIGTYCYNSHKDVLKHMLGNNLTIEELDCLILNLLKSSNKYKNIYFLTSRSDEQFETQIEPYLSGFHYFFNFNLFYSESILVRAHNQVTSHHIQFILSLFYSLINNLCPVYGTKFIKGDSEIRSDKKDCYEAFAELRDFKIDGHKIYPEGIGIVRGYDFENWVDVEYILLLENDCDKYEIKMAKGEKPELTKEFYNGYFCIYDKAWFCTLKYEGIDISFVSSGIYNLILKIFLRNDNKWITCSLSSKKQKWISSENFEIEILSNGVCRLHIK